MLDFEEELSLEELQKSAEFVWNGGECRRTPMILGFQECLPLKASYDLHLKMECSQLTGSFKFRGAYCQMSGMKAGQEVFTYSGGNYGKAFATMSQKLGLNSVVLMPKSAPTDRVKLIQSLGSKAEIYETMFEVCQKRDEYLAKGIKYLDPFDDLKLIKGYASVGFEILEAVPQPDVVLVPCGGGGLLSGVSASLARAGLKHTKIFGIEPVTAATMYESFRQGKPASIPDSHSIANGLCPTRSGDLTTPICRKFVTEILLVNDLEIVQAVRALYEVGIKIEPTGAACVAALMFDKIPPEELAGKTVVAVLSGSNITLEDLCGLLEL